MFDKKIDRASFKNELKFQTEKLYMHSSVTYDDKNILEILKDNIDEEVTKPTVYATDTFILALMTLKNSEFPWYIWVQKDGKHILLDKYEKEKEN